MYRDKICVYDKHTIVSNWTVGSKVSDMYTLVDSWIAQLVAYRLGTGEVLGSNSGEGENFSVKIRSSMICNV